MSTTATKTPRHLHIVPSHAAWNRMTDSQKTLINTVVEELHERERRAYRCAYTSPQRVVARLASVGQLSTACSVILSHSSKSRAALVAARAVGILMEEGHRGHAEQLTEHLATI